MIWLPIRSWRLLSSETEKSTKLVSSKLAAKVLETDEKKLDWLKISLLLKSPQFFANPNETWLK